jgi:hypothetical protein
MPPQDSENAQLDLGAREKFTLVNTLVIVPLDLADQKRPKKQR